jgi:hypothetical protein
MSCSSALLYWSPHSHTPTPTPLCLCFVLVNSLFVAPTPLLYRSVLHHTGTHRFYVAAKALAASLTAEEKAAGMCFPRVSRIRQISAEVATAVVGEAVSSGMAGEGVQSSPNPDWVLNQMYNPHYGPLISVKDYF